jgi:hypothetical protein
MIYGCTEHHTWAYLRGEGDFDPDSSADAIVDLVLSGLQKREPSAPMQPDLAQRIERAVERLEKIGVASKSG